jgi:transcriptional regulator with XRE-family HTH domain
MTRNLDGARSPMAFFGAELRRARATAGMSQDQLGRALSFSGDLVGKVETCERAPTPELAAGCDRVFSHLGGLFTRLLELARRWDGPHPQWFRDWVQAEREATSLRTWQPLLVPGLLQTADYARALFQAWRSADNEDDQDQQVGARMERQLILEPPKPTTMWVVVDEGVLRRRIGSEKIMREQLGHLEDMFVRPKITIQVVPAEVGAHVGLLGSFTIASFDDRPDMVYMDTPDQGQITEKRAMVARISEAFDLLRAEALPRAASLGLIRKVAEERWT